MRILLVKPWPRLATVRGLERFLRLEPLELGYLAAATPPQHTVRILDLRLSHSPKRAFAKALSAFRPDLVGFTGYTHEASRVKELATLTKRHRPSAFVVTGGHHATLVPDDYNLPEIDAIVRGEGCTPFAAVVAALEQGTEVSGVPGVLRTGVAFDAAAARALPPPFDPAALPAPRRDLWKVSDYYAVWVTENPEPGQSLFPPVALARTSYGCSMRCSFCVVPMLSGGKHRPRSVEAVVAEIASITAGHVYFCDDETFLDHRFAWELADELARQGVRKRYFAWGRASSVNRWPDLFRRWREVGLDAVFIGFEFPTDAQLKGVGKGATVAANEKALDTLRGMGVAVHAAFMLQPEETRESFEVLRAYVRGLPPVQCSFTVCTPSPGTPAYATLEPNVWVPNPHDLHDAMHPLTPTKLPLKEFAALYARQAAEGINKSPVDGRPVPRLRDIARATWAHWAYRRSFKNLYRDHPRNLWG
ncbi:MAG TPA: radical SAM protein [Vicinamibacteria bacterium]|nr:radical SAM protein [Vicinamibacteria bacterium]